MVNMERVTNARCWGCRADQSGRGWAAVLEIAGDADGPVGLCDGCFGLAQAAVIDAYRPPTRCTYCENPEPATGWPHYLPADGPDHHLSRPLCQECLDWALAWAGLTAAVRGH